MAETAQITCINKQPRNDPYHRITHVGGHGINPWKLTVDDAIGKIESGEWGFFVLAGGESVWVMVAVSRAGNKYLKTEADGDKPNNLLSLPECP